MEREELEGEGIAAVGIDWCIYLYKKQVLPVTCGIHHQAQVVQKLDSAIHRINHYPADTYYYPAYNAIIADTLDSAIQRLNNRGTQRQFSGKYLFVRRFEI